MSQNASGFGTPTVVSGAEGPTRSRRDCFVTSLLAKTLGQIGLLRGFFLAVSALSSFAADVPFNRWHYQLQGYDGFIDKHAADTATLFVIDYSRDGTQAGAFKADEITRLKNKGANRVIAYLSIGEAEEVRWYYKTMPKSVRMAANPLFPDNFPVKYWDKRWQSLIAHRSDSSLKRILKAGFDGVYLDTVDVFYQFPKRPSAAREMAEWVMTIADSVHASGSAKIVIQQNAPCLPDRGGYSSLDDKAYNALMERYWRAVDGIALESTFHFGEKWDDNELAPQAEVLRCLKQYEERGKWRVGVEYVRAEPKRRSALVQLRAHGILGLVTDRHLRGEFFDYATRSSAEP